MRAKYNYIPCALDSNHRKMSIESEIESLVAEAKDLGFQNGILRKSTKRDGEIEMISFTLWPSQLQRSHLDFLLQLQKDYNSLIDVISRNKNLLLDSLQK